MRKICEENVYVKCMRKYVCKICEGKYVRKICEENICGKYVWKICMEKKNNKLY